MNNIASQLENGTICLESQDIMASHLQWNPHPNFNGVALKHLITGEQTGGAFSAHIVRLNPGAAIDTHVHQTNWELHEVADGTGQCILNGRTLEYAPGVAAVLPENVPHKVEAGENGLTLLAKFVPALL